MEQKLPVRVVRGHKCQNSYVGKVYTYDGLYMVTMFFYDRFKCFRPVGLHMQSPNSICTAGY